MSIFWLSFVLFKISLPLQLPLFFSSLVLIPPPNMYIFSQLLSFFCSKSGHSLSLLRLFLLVLGGHWFVSGDEKEGKEKSRYNLLS